MDAFRGMRTPVLVATNVAARGLDISHVDLVVNYDLPDSAEWLTHRVGRTARMGDKGRALTFIAPEDISAWRDLRRHGAPDLPELDLAHLLAEGDWRYLAASLVQPAAAAPARIRPPVSRSLSSASPRRRRGPRRAYGRRRDPGALTG
jgi:ATP-dependent RNA helicase DeaD